MKDIKDVNILGIETSCDETAISIVKNGNEVLVNLISSQIDLHREYGGVVPELASRKHIETIAPLFERALQEGGITLNEIDGIAVTYGPGLVGALLVGLSFAKGLAYTLNIPLIGVHHIEGHIYGNFIEHQPRFPLLALIVSGGHTHLVMVKGHADFEILGHTLDDAAGEAFDKIARVLGLGYPGGPIIDRIASQGDGKSINFPRALLDEDSLDFSFSGLKSSVINYINREKQMGQELKIADIAASFQDAVIDALIIKIKRALKVTGVRTLALAGGVAANSLLRYRVKEIEREEGINIMVPSIKYCTDNGAMIACRGYYLYKLGFKDGLDLNAVPYLPIGSKIM